MDWSLVYYVLLNAIGGLTLFVWDVLPAVAVGGTCVLAVATFIQWYLGRVERRPQMETWYRF
jgi:hypothetical protein